MPKPGDGKEEGPSMLNERNCGPAHLRQSAILHSDARFAGRVGRIPVPNIGMRDENRLANLVPRIMASNEIQPIAMRCFAMRWVGFRWICQARFGTKFAIDTKTGGRADGNGGRVAGMGGVRTGE